MNEEFVLSQVHVDGILRAFRKLTWEDVQAIEPVDDLLEVLELASHFIDMESGLHFIHAVEDSVTYARDTDIGKRFAGRNSSDPAVQQSLTESLEVWQKVRYAGLRGFFALLITCGLHKMGENPFSQSKDLAA